MNRLYQDMLGSVEQEIAELKLPQNPALLYDPIKYMMDLGGKRIRPVLVLHGCSLFDTDHLKAIKQALAVEVFHNFTLVHDDVMDSADVRRKLPTVHKKWTHNVALLSGDAMLVLAYQLLLENQLDKGSELASLFSKTAMEVCEGQQLDMDLANGGQVHIEEYLEMIRLKTAVLLSASLNIGAIVGGGQPVHELTSFAESLGLAFQVKDDYLDAFGSKEFGKAIGGDIREGKRTWLTVKSFEVADAETQSKLELAYNNENLDARVERVLDLYRTLEVDKMAESEVIRYSALATDSLYKVNGNKKAIESLNWLSEQLIGRTS